MKIELSSWARTALDVNATRRLRQTYPRTRSLVSTIADKQGSADIVNRRGLCERVSHANRLSGLKFDDNRVPIVSDDSHRSHSATRQCARDWLVIGGYFGAIARPRRRLESSDKSYPAAAHDEGPDECLVSSEVVLMDEHIEAEDQV